MALHTWVTYHQVPHRMPWMRQCPNRTLLMQRRQQMQAPGIWNSRAVLARSLPLDPFESLRKSKVFENTQVLQEFETMTKEMMEVVKMSTRFPDFDVIGKRMYVDKMREGIERHEIFIKRLELSDDPASKEFLRITNAQMLNGGFSFRGMFAGSKERIGLYEHWVALEEAALAAGPARHQEYLKEFRQAWKQTMRGSLNFQELANSLPADVLWRAQQDPQLYLAVKEILENPSPEVTSRWMQNERLAPLVAELVKAMQL